jgi:hypothetical protein
MPLPSQVVHQRLRSSAQKYRWSRGVRFVLAGGALALLLLVIFLGLDAWLHFGAGGRWTGFILTLSAVLGGAVLGWRAWLPAISEASMARRIEQSSGLSGNVLINAVQFDHSLAGDAALRNAVLGELADPFPGVQWDRVFDVKLLQRLGIALGVVCAVIFLFALIKPNYFANSAARLFLPASDIAPLTRTHIEAIFPGNATIVHGRDVVVTASLGGEVPRTAWVFYRQAGSSWQKALMDRDAGQPVVSFHWKDMRAPLEYRIGAGDAMSAIYRLDVRPQTAIKTRTTTIDPPAYTGLLKTTAPDSNLVQGIVPGSQLRTELNFNNPLTELVATEDKGAEVKIAGSGTHWTLTTRLMATETVKLNFKDNEGAEDQASMQFAVKADDPPRITIVDPAEGRDLIATKTARLKVRFAATDNFGLGDVAIYQSTPDKDDARLVQNFPQAKGEKSLSMNAEVPLESLAGDDDRVTLRIVARDQNDVTGPGVTTSRPIVVSLKSADKLEKQIGEAVSKLQKNLEALIKLQAQNLDETRTVAIKVQTGSLGAQIERQLAIADAARQLAGAADGIAPEIRNDLNSMLDKEMKVAVLALRDADGATGAPRARFLGTAIANEAAILARLQGAPSAVDDDAKKGEVQDLISGIEDLLKQQRALHKESSSAVAAAAAQLSDRQDKLADKAQLVRQHMDIDSKNAAIGDAEFRKRLAEVVGMFGQLKVYEDMLAAAEHLQGAKMPVAVATQQKVVVNLAKMVELLNQWQLAEAQKAADDLKKKAKLMQQKLEKLIGIQHEIVEKSKDMARKDDFRKEDIATAKSMKDSKDLMKDVIEQMTTDLQAFPDLKPGNEMRSELVSILEEVEQQDKQAVADGKLKPQEIAVQKEQGILDAMKNAEKLAADMEMWLPNKTETQKWLLENFDKTELPNIPNVPLQDATEDIVGKLMDEQKDIQKDIQDAASNQLMAQNPANGWEIRDGPMGSFGAQGKSGNERPNHNEQMGRSSGGREGMSDGEMAGDTASNLEGDTPDARRTKDPLQQGQVKDNGGIGKTRATGGGKAGGFSDRNGMEGNAPLRAVKAPNTEVKDALAVKQMLLAEKTAKTTAQASLLYIRNDGLAQVAKLMDESAQALKDGRIADAASLHQKIIGRLRELKNGVSSGEVISVAGQDGTRAGDKQLLGGSEGDAPPQYKDQVADYFRSLVEEK